MKNIKIGQSQQSEVADLQKKINDLMQQIGTISQRQDLQKFQVQQQLNTARKQLSDLEQKNQNAKQKLNKAAKFYNLSKIAGPAQNAEVDKAVSDAAQLAQRQNAQKVLAQQQQQQRLQQQAQAQRKVQQAADRANAAQTSNVSTMTSASPFPKMAKFNLKKFAQQQTVKFNNISQFIDYLDGANAMSQQQKETMVFIPDQSAVKQFLLQHVDVKDQQFIDGFLKQYYSQNWDQVQDAQLKKIQIAKPVWTRLNKSAKNIQPQQLNLNQDQNMKQENPNQQQVVAFVKDIQGQIKKQAESDAVVKTKNVFNLKKTAQFNSTPNNSVIMYGPSQKRFDPFLRQPVTDWNIVQRNKGFGLVIDDIWNIDYETIWRGNIMDKYSSQYIDKNGVFTGGYFGKRFETDRFQPQQNKMQLSPGTRRKQYDPKERSLQARMQSARGSKDVNKIASTDNKISGSFNLKTAQLKKKDNTLDQSGIIVGTKTFQYVDGNYKDNQSGEIISPDQFLNIMDKEIQISQQPNQNTIVTAQLKQLRKPKGSQWMNGPSTFTQRCNTCGANLDKNSGKCSNESCINRDSGSSTVSSADSKNPNSIYNQNARLQKQKQNEQLYSQNGQVVTAAKKQKKKVFYSQKFNMMDSARSPSARAVFDKKHMINTTNSNVDNAQGCAFDGPTVNNKINRGTDLINGKEIKYMSDPHNQHQHNDDTNDSAWDLGLDPQ